MEPPAKRRRKGPSPPTLGQNDDQDDELASHPQEITVRRDPDIQFTLKRANADHKLQATMAHIIEKYSRDFEGVGDEIDMETGEIVVNNGHLRNMRDEGDVEGLWMDGDSNAEEDEGILLEDLTDEYSDDQDDMDEPRNPEADKDQDSTTKEKDSNADPNLKERAKGPDSTTASAGETKNQDERLPSETHSPKDGAPDEPPHRFAPSPFGPGAPSGYGPPPAAFGPWSMMPGFPMAAWGRDDIPPYYNMPPSMPNPWFNGGRYEFPTNDGQTSIWGRGRAKKTKPAGFMKRSSKGHAQSSVQPGKNPADEETGGDDSNKENSGEQQPENQEALASDRVISASDESDDLIYSGTTDSPPTKPSPVPLAQKELVEETVRTKPTEKALEETAGNVVKVPSHDHEKDGEGDRRRSGRVRKQAEYMGKISWTEARELRKSSQGLSVELHRVDPASRLDFESIDSSDDESLSSQGTAEQSPPRTVHGEAEKVVQKQVIPDSQDTATPFNSSAPQPSQPQASQPQVPQSTEKQSNPGTLGQNDTPSMALSDDEAPIVLSRVKAPQQRAAPLKPVPRLASLQEEYESSTDNVATPSIDDTQKGGNNETSQAEPEKATQAETKDAVASDTLAQPLKRKRGRPKKPETITKVTSIESTITVSLGPAPRPPKRRVGRPRKSSIIAREADTSAQVREQRTPQPKPTPQVEVQPAEEAEGPRRISNELKWLEKKKPKSVSDLEARGATSRKRLRSRGSKETLQQSHVGADEVQSFRKEPEAITTNEPPSPARATSSPTDIPTTFVVPPENPISPADDPSMSGAASSPRVASPAESVPPPRAISPPAATPAVEAAPANTSSVPQPVPPVESASQATASSPSKPVSPPRHVSPPRAVSVEETIAPAQDHQAASNTHREPAVQLTATPRKNKDTAVHPAGTPSNSSKPHTPRHTSIRTTRAPSSRRSLLSFVSDSESDSDRSRDELARKVRMSSHKKSARPSTHKIWRSTALTTELHRTPSRRRRNDPPTPVKTPGGTLRTCGVDGNRCGRDFCFTCLPI